MFRLLTPRLRTAIITSFAFFGIGCALSVRGPSLPSLADALASNQSTLGSIFTFFAIGVIAVQFLLIKLDGRVAKSLILASSAALFGLASITMALAINLPIMFIASAIAGLGFGGVLNTGNVLIAQHYAENSTSALNAINIFYGLGSVAGPFIVALSSQALAAPHSSLTISGIILLAAVPLILLGVRQATTSNTKQQQHIRQRPIANYHWFWLGVIIFIYMGIEIAFAAWSTSYLLASTSISITSASLLTSVYWFTFTIGRSLAAKFGQQFNPINLVLVCSASIVLGTILMSFSVGNLVFTMLSIAIFGLFSGPMFPTIVAIANSSTSDSSITSKLLVFSNVGGMIFPAMLGYSINQMSALSGAIFLVISTLILLIINISILRQPSAEHQLAS